MNLLGGLCSVLGANLLVVLPEPGHDCVRLISVSYCDAIGCTKDLFPGKSSNLVL